MTSLGRAAQAVDLYLKRRSTAVSQFVYWLSTLWELIMLSF